MIGLSCIFQMWPEIFVFLQKQWIEGKFTQISYKAPYVMFVVRWFSKKLKKKQQNCCMIVQPWTGNMCCGKEMLSVKLLRRRWKSPLCRWSIHSPQHIGWDHDRPHMWHVWLMWRSALDKYFDLSVQVRNLLSIHKSLLYTVLTSAQQIIHRCWGNLIILIKLFCTEIKQQQSLG